MPVFPTFFFFLCLSLSVLLELLMCWSAGLAGLADVLVYWSAGLLVFICVQSKVVLSLLPHQQAMNSFNIPASTERPTFSVPDQRIYINIAEIEHSIKFLLSYAVKANANTGRPTLPVTCRRYAV